jgi:hypothetical protein
VITEGQVPHDSLAERAIHHRGYGTQNLVASACRPLMADSAVLRIRRWWSARSCGRLVPMWPGSREARLFSPPSRTVPWLHRLSAVPPSMEGEWRAVFCESAKGPWPPRRLRQGVAGAAAMASGNALPCTG